MAETPTVRTEGVNNGPLDQFTEELLPFRKVDPSVDPEQLASWQSESKVPSVQQQES